MTNKGGCLVRFDSSAERTDEAIEGSPSVCVLMSTYNGERYLSEQINSIADQDEVTVSLVVRDDGSHDGTAKLAENISEERGLICSVEKGQNVGFLRSFEDLLLRAEGSDFYAFSDQDDVWSQNKLAKAVSVLAAEGEHPALYASSVEITDEKLVPISWNDYPGYTYSIRSEFIRHRLAGHTMVWNNALQNAIKTMGALSVWSHDQHVVLAGLLSSAKLFLDSASYVKHRRLATSLTPGGGSPIKRIQHELKMTLNTSKTSDRGTLAAELLDLPGIRLGGKDIEFLNNLILYKTDKRKRIKFAFSPLLSCGLSIADYEARISVLLGRF